MDKNIANNFFDLFKLVILTILAALLIYPIFLIIFIPISIYRIVVYYLVKMFDPKVIQIISGLSAVMTGDDPYTNPEFVMMTVFLLKTKVDRNQIVDVINKQILSSNQFLELSQRIVRKFGYNFWYATNRKITGEDHVHFLNPNFPDEPITRSQIFEHDTQKLSRRPFPSDRSPWEIILVPNLLDEDDPSNKSLAILRTHHCLMDGYSLRNFVEKAAVKPWSGLNFSQASDNRKTSKWEFLLKLVILVVAGPYHVIKQALFMNDNSNFMNMVLDQQRNTDPQLLAKGIEPRACIDMQRLKNAKKVHNTNISSILVTMVMGAAVRLIKKHWGKVEKNMHLQMSYPIPGHPGRPTNHWTTVRMPVYFDENDVVKSLKRNIEEFDKVQNSVLPILNFYLSELLGHLPSFMIPKTEDMCRQSILLTNMPGPVGKEDIFGYTYDDVAVHAVMPNGSAIVFGCLSACGKFGMHFGGNSDIFKTKKGAEEVQDSLEDILKILEAK